MHKVLFLTGAVLLSSCSSNGPLSFDRMSEEQIHAYNVGKPVLEQIYCYKRTVTGSHINQRHCDKVINIVNDSVRNQQQLLVIDQ